ncbi:voltage-gated potassium channel regulatory subunit KCNG4-like [Anarhichas minor]|uniref:voltage-gated potassium channel regulatory subunit KCNG4-like n=1 Tax=Anarhichas minor TaxID=65739 RepID=UPI0012ED48C7|nr:potassium voltage-gated channel subfamily G member 4-like isoform X2 [Anarrhichthys ocellatus]
MPIISNANHDFSTYSISSDDSSLDQFFTEIPETETIKGVYFQRAQLLRDPKASYVVDHTLQVLINVGGNRYTFPWSTLEQFPQSRLGRLRFCTTPEEIARLCDDYDETCQEYFFDRNPTAFRVILNFLAAGKLRLLRELCAVSLHDELNYWGVDPSHMERCCRRRMNTRVEEVAERERKEHEWRQKRVMLKKSTTETKKGYHKLTWMLREVVENPQSGLAAKMFACLSVVMVLVTVISLCISTMPDLRDEETRGECSQKCQSMFVVESICVAWFTLEFLLRFVNAQSKLAFARGPLNIIDAIAILPYYVSLVVDVRDESQEDVFIVGAGRGYLDKLSLILRLLRALRILYVMRLARHSLGLQTLGMTMQRSMREFGLLLLFVCVAVTLFSPLVHLAESELAPFAATHPQHSFSSIPASYWWAIISMTTVGYGDMVPRSIPGQIVALTSILSGILIMAFPATSIFHTFSRSYQELKQEYEQLWKEERGEEIAAESEESWSKINLSPNKFTSVSNENNDGLISSKRHQSTVPSTAF